VSLSKTPRRRSLRALRSISGTEGVPNGPDRTRPYAIVLLEQPKLLFYREIDTRKLQVPEVTAHQSEAWAVPQATDLADEFAERNQGAESLIRDRGAKFTAAFDEAFRTHGIQIIHTRVRALRANALAEGLVGTIRRQCLNRMLIVNRRHLARHS
jgi:putative transposase